MVKKVSSV